MSLHEDHYTTKGIVENGTYSVNVPSTRLLSLADYCGLVSGHRVDKSRLFETFYGELGTAPMAAECPVNLECRVVPHARGWEAPSLRGGGRGGTRR